MRATPPSPSIQSHLTSADVTPLKFLAEEDETTEETMSYMGFSTRLVGQEERVQVPLLVCSAQKLLISIATLAMLAS